MKIPFIPNSTSVISDLAPLVPTLYGALESGTQYGREYFERLEQSVDAALYPCIVRYHARNLLAEQRSMGSLEFTMEELANNGLSISFGRYRIRIYKAPDEKRVPVPGTSKVRQAFWSQEFKQLPLPYAEMTEEELEKLPVNLLILWEVSSSYTFIRLRVACPKGGDVAPDSAETHWDKALPHAAELASHVVSEPSSMEDFDDLDISLPAEEIRTRRSG